MTTRAIRWALPLATLPLVALVGCVDTDLEASAPVVFAEFDPTAQPPRVPTPIELGGPATPVPGGTPAGAPFSAPLDPSTVDASDVLALDLVAQAPVPVQVALADGDQTLVITPAGGAWPAGHRIAIAIHGDLAGAGGEEVVASPTFYFARAPRPIATCTTPAPDCASTTPLLPIEQAMPLEALRQALAPLMQALGVLGIPPDTVVVAWTFTVEAP